MNEPTFRITSKSTMTKGAPASPQPPVYNCQAPGCEETSDTIACSRHLFMLPLSIISALTNAIATGEGGLYGPAMKEAMNIWTTEPD